MGNDFAGQLGSPATPTSAQVAVPVPGLTNGVTALSGGNVACAITAGGEVVCWGANCGYGYLQNGGLACLDANGNEETPDAGSWPTEVAPMPVKAFGRGVIAVGAGAGSLCAILSNGTVACMGVGPQVPGMTFTSRPLAVPGVAGATALSVGMGSACVITAGGRLLCWGAGPLGNASVDSSGIPVQVTGLTSGVRAVAVSQQFACAVTGGGGVVCWGNNDGGQLGNGTRTSSLVPVQATGLTSGATAVAVAPYSPAVCAVTASGGLLCWGEIRSGPSLTPAPINGLTGAATAAALGFTFVCALTAGDSVDCWGGICTPPGATPFCAQRPTAVPGF
jgi:alpha-tubulin suppressor-like RCC1 family protein